MVTFTHFDSGAPPADRRAQRGQNTRERLLATARDEFGRRGYDGTPIAAVLTAAGVARGALYHHFSSKEALFEAVLDRTVADIAVASGRAARRENDAVERLRAGCCVWLDATMDAAVQRIALVDALAVVGWARCREIDERHILGGLRANLEQIADQGRLPRTDVPLLAHMVLAAVSEAALMLARAKEPGAALVTGKATVDALLTRLTSPPDINADHERKDQP